MATAAHISARERAADEVIRWRAGELRWASWFAREWLDSKQNDISMALVSGQVAAQLDDPVELLDAADRLERFGRKEHMPFIAQLRSAAAASTDRQQRRLQSGGIGSNRQGR